MTKLSVLRNQLASLRRWRQLVRWATAYSAVVTAILWALAGIFVVDLFFFEIFSTSLDVLQRAIVMTIAACGAFASFWYFTRPLLGVVETNLDMALLVEKNQRINSDLVAALQFESPDAPKWGSVQLESAVVEYVAHIGRSLNVFSGFSREQMVRRGAIMLATIVVLGALGALFPEYAWTFANRLAMSPRHYPTDTVIQKVVVNGKPVLVRTSDETTPRRMKAAQGQPLTFTIQATGRLPDIGAVELKPLSSSSRRPLSIPLKQLTLDERLTRLKDAAGQFENALNSEGVDVAAPWIERVTSLVQFDAPAAVALLAESENDRTKLKEAATALNEVIVNWRTKSIQDGVYVGQLDRMIDPVAYNVYLGDTWTEQAVIDMIPLPAVEPRLTSIPPQYARNGKPQVHEPSARHISVLEGSEVKVAIECTNNKPLTEAWLVVKTREQSRKFSLTKADETGLRWSLDARKTPFKPILEDVRFTIQVTDEDGLHLETPIECFVRLKADRPPRGTADVVHRVVLPSARPVIQYNATDDYGIARIVLHAQVERREDGETETDRVDEKHSQDVPLDGEYIPAEQLPYRSTYPFDLSSLDLQKGDRIRLTLEIVDYRGEREGESFSCDPLVLEISDESGVLAAISEADERSEQRLTDIIKQQLGIGGSP